MLVYFLLSNSILLNVLILARTDFFYSGFFMKKFECYLINELSKTWQTCKGIHDVKSNLLIVSDDQNVTLTGTKEFVFQ